MLEKEPSGASPDCNQPSQLASAAPGGPSPRGRSAMEATLTPPVSLPLYTLQFLIAEIKKARLPGSPANTEAR